MKVYVILGKYSKEDTGYSRWYDKAFTSREAAKQYLQTQVDKFILDQARISYLVTKLDITREYDYKYALSETERNELTELEDRWDKCWSRPPIDSYIAEFEVCDE